MSQIALFVSAALALTQAAPQTTTAPARPATDLTRDLNSGPPFAAPPALVTPAAATPAVATPTPAPVRPAATPPVQAAPVSAATVSPAPRPAAPQPSTSQPAPSVRPAAVTPTPAPRPLPVTPSPATTPTTQNTTMVAPPAPAPAPVGLSPASVAALPFTVDLSGGLSITEGRPGADFHVYSVKRGDLTLVMIYAGPASQFPIYDGQMIQAGGRASIVVTEDGRRMALEHLFQRPTAPREIHVWVASVDGADRALAERIGQSVDAR